MDTSFLIIINSKVAILHDITSITDRTIKVVIPVYILQYDLVYHQQEIKGDQFLNLSIGIRKS